MPQFVPGLTLARAFYEEVVSALLGETAHSAALVGTGSDVLGFDTERSIDHHWGPKLTVFVASTDVADVRDAVENGLPEEFRGWPTRFGWDAVPVTHHVEVHALADWFREQLGFDSCVGVTTRDWLTTPQQVLLELTAGDVFHDGLRELVPAGRRSRGTRTTSGSGSSPASGGG